MSDTHDSHASSLGGASHSRDHRNPDSRTDTSWDTTPASPSEIDYEADPLLRLERNNRSTKQALAFFVGTIVVTAVVAIAVAIVSAVSGGPYCDADPSANLCSAGHRIAFMALPTSTALLGLFGSAWIAYLKWRKHQRWRPWLAAVWFLMPFALSWVVTAGTMMMGQF